MQKISKIGPTLLVIVAMMLFSLSHAASAVVYPYSVKIGDKISYKATTVKKGTSQGSYNLSGLIITEGMEFQLEVFDASASPVTYFGDNHQFKAVSGENKSQAFSGRLFVFTSNASFWTNQSGYTFDSLGTIYAASLENNTRIFTYSYVTDAENLIVYKFNIDDGILVKYERKTSSTTTNYTHFVMEKAGGLFGLPGFEVTLFLAGMLSICALVVIRKRQT